MAGKYKSIITTAEDLETNFDDNINFNNQTSAGIIAVEYLKGTSFCIKYDTKEEDFKVAFNKKETKRNREELILIDANINSNEMPLYAPFRRLRKILGNEKVNFTVFAEYISYDNQVVPYFEKKNERKFFVQDIYINKNWINHIDLIKFCKLCNLSVAPILYDGKYDEKAFNLFANCKGSAVNKMSNKFGVSVKSFIEDKTVGQKRMAKIFYNKDFIPVEPKPKNNLLAAPNVIEEAERHLEWQRNGVLDTITSYGMSYFPGIYGGWNTVGEKPKNKGIVIEKIVKVVMEKHFSHYGNWNLERKKYMQKAMRKVIAKEVIKAFDLNNAFKK